MDLCCTEELFNPSSCFLAFAEGFPDPIVVISEAGRIAYYNKATMSLLGYTPEELIGKPADILFLRLEHRSCLAVPGNNSKVSGEEYTLIIRAEIFDKSRRPLPAELVMCPMYFDDKFFYAIVFRCETRPELQQSVNNAVNSVLTPMAQPLCMPVNRVIVGCSNSTQHIRSMISLVAKTDSSVLITGESGTGKELIAEALHTASNRADRPMVKLNCSALPETLLESELFGHVKGAFTGAVKDNPGRFQVADGGTLFLDEIGDISPALQAKLLRVLEDHEFNRIGESVPIKVDVRIITATNKDLNLLIQQKIFRADLFFRLKVIEITVPPLCERTDDIALLVRHFLTQLNYRFKKNICAVSDEVMKLFFKYRWPGNIRELAHALEHAFIVCHEDIIELHHLPTELQKIRVADSGVTENTFFNEGDRLREALSKSGGNKALAARLLGVNRKTIYRQIKKNNVYFRD
jgi:transcriptional regulator with PAS, ATPase and Fis domain